MRELIMKKNGILTLLFACIPGAGQMLSLIHI